MDGGLGLDCEIFDLTEVGVVVNEENFFHEGRRGSVEHGVNCPQEDGPSLVVKNDDDRRIGQLIDVERG